MGGEGPALPSQEVLNSGVLGSRKGCNVPGVPLGLPPLCDSDVAAIKVGAQLVVHLTAIATWMR